MNVAEFVAKWRKVELKERSAAQEHFLDLCHVVGHPTPAEADPTGETFCFERGAAKHGGGEGFADVWKKDFFGWEYKGKHKDLAAAFDQLLKYRDALANPPLLVVCDLDRIVVRTNFTGTVSAVHEIPLEAMGEPRNVEILRAVFFDPAKLKPGRTSEAMTEEAAKRFAGIAEAMRKRGLDPAAVAHFLNRLVFCLFAEDIGLLPGMIFSRIVEKSGGDPARFRKLLAQLFEAMAHGGDFGLDAIRHFNGNLFEDAAVLDLTAEDMKALAGTAGLDWGAIDPSIFGTLFERGLDPAKRSQLGAHYTSRADIETLVDAVVMAPLRREWDETRTTLECLLATGKKKPGPASSPPLAPRPSSLSGPALKKARGEADSILHGFLTRLQGVRVLDPACGSGNFLYVTLQRLKDLEKEAIVFGMDRGLGGYLPAVGPLQLFGIEINPYAHDLAQTAVWIGFLQWTRANGFQMTQDPVLRPMKDNFRCMDSILDLSDPAAPKEPTWPTVDFIVGNPPFLGDKLMRRELGDDYVDRLRDHYANRIPGQSDLCCYWFERARAHIEAGKCKRAGLLSTQGIRGGKNRVALQRIKDTGGIFWAMSDMPWILDGANVHVSMVGFDDGTETVATLDGRPVREIQPNLTCVEGNMAGVGRLEPNQGLGFIGVAQKAPFDVPDASAIAWLNAPNPSGKPNSDVLRPIVNATDITRRYRWTWNVDFGLEMTEAQSAHYEAPFKHVSDVVRPLRVNHREARQEKYWWLFARPCPDMREALPRRSRFLATPRVSKHRVFTWLPPELLCDSAVVAFARSDDYFFGVLHSRAHEVWALAQGTQLREKESGFRYTPTTCFETFPFPEPTDAQREAIGAAAAELNALRERWLNPPEWTRAEVLEFPGTVGGPWDRFIAPGSAQPLAPRPSSLIGLVRYPRTVPKDADCAAKLAKRTLTALYNERPAWLANAHAALDAAVFAAYGWLATPERPGEGGPPDLSDAAILERLLALNLARAGESGD